MTILEDDEQKDTSSSTEPITINHTLHTSPNIPCNNISLSPAVSAFQQFWPSSGNLAPGTSSSSSSSLSTSPLGKSSIGNHTMLNDRSRPMDNLTLPLHIKDGYVYKDKIVILDQERKEQLLKVGTILLQGEWTYWYDRYVPNLPASEYEANLQIISTVGSVQKFWSVYNNIDGPEKLGFRSNLHFMRKGIKPIWEDPKNEYGGSYNFKVNKAQSPLVWRDLLVLLIGEKIEQWLKDTVCGVSVSSRQHCDNYQIWVSNGQDNSDDNGIKASLADALGPVDIQSFYFKNRSLT
ncbi:translation initiation factor eIF 4e-like domain-containing protein [Chlamydoabsidia padenii]|nr:translation initiation factor eIF 4e-like domain-containing protein [Chlamydoabsidia padenii]